MPELRDDQFQTFSQVHLDPELTSVCAQGVLAAYADFDGQPVRLPPGFRAVAHFTGWDQIFFATGREERFGLVLQSVTEPSTYVVAFRGTSSLLDGYEDIWATTVDFVPHHDDGHFPSDVAVASGFNSIYTTQGAPMAASMQKQLFRILDRLQDKPVTVAICGHSLGGPLANQFALDVAVSRPHIAVVNTTFASPRTGLGKWQGTYDHQYRLQGRTFRIANYWDLIPTLPPEFLGYHHVGEQFLASFFVKDSYLPHYLSRHSMLNYQYVIDRAVRSTPQVWTGKFPDAARPGWTMISTAPPTAQMPEWAQIQVQALQEVVEGL